MPNSIKNTSTVSNYQYIVNPSENPVIKGPISDYVENPFVEAKVDFNKVCNPKYVDLGGTFTIDYIVSNTTPYPATWPQLNKVVVKDNIVLTSPLIKVTPGVNVIKVDPTAGTFEVDLSTKGGTLDPGESITATFSVTVILTPPNPEDLNTLATAIFDVKDSTKQFTASSTCGVIVNHGELEITKDSNPVGTVSCGQTITYTIVIKNIGNITVTILPEKFLDTIPDGTTFGSIISSTPAQFVYDEGTGKIINNDNVVIGAGDSITIKFNVTVDC